MFSSIVHSWAYAFFTCSVEIQLKAPLQTSKRTLRGDCFFNAVFKVEHKQSRSLCFDDVAVWYWLYEVCTLSLSASLWNLLFLLWRRSADSVFSTMKIPWRMLPYNASQQFYIAHCTDFQMCAHVRNELFELFWYLEGNFWICVSLIFKLPKHSVYICHVSQRCVRQTRCICLGALLGTPSISLIHISHCCCSSHRFLGYLLAFHRVSAP